MRICLLVLATCVGSVGVAEDWQQFRGGTAGKLTSVTHPMEWDGEKNIAWAVPIAGSGWSSPVVVGDRLYLTAAVSEKPSKPKGMTGGVRSMGSYRSAKPGKHTFMVHCLSLKDGGSIWKKTVGEMVPPAVHPSNTYATESPATDGKHVFTFFATTGTLLAWDLDGKELWRKELGTYKTGNGFGTGSSLAILDGTVFVQFDNDEKSFVAAFKGETGDEVWRADRKSGTSWATPLIWSNAKRKELLTCGSSIVTSYNPADGKVLWQLKGMESGFSSSPAVDGDQIFFGNSGPMSAAPLVSVAAGTSGEMQLDKQFKSDAIAWSRTRSGPGMASPVVSKGYLYIPGSSGVLNCYDVKTGERAFQKRVPKLGTVVASLWADDDSVFILDESGTTFVLAAGPEYKLLRTNSIKDLFWSTPSIAGDALLLRGVDKLYCVRK